MIASCGIIYVAVFNSDYLLFLRREDDGRYAPVAGQTDSVFSFFVIQSRIPVQ